jgi:hypothetical protein
MSHLVQQTNAFHTAGAGKALTAAYVAGDTIQPWGPANTLRLRCTLAWAAAPTSVQVMIDWSTNGGTTWVPVSVVNSVTAGTVALADGIFSVPVAAVGTHEICVGVPPGADLRCRAKMVDAGASDPTLLAVAVLTDE